ncbi:MAG: OmpA family protein [Bdellovibrionales bacterium]|nr:OmpA family protein [Bdellovibrionales bacterium]
MKSGPKVLMILACAAMASCAPTGRPSVDDIQQNVSTARAGLFGKCLEHFTVAGQSLVEAEFQLNTIEKSHVTADSSQYKRARFMADRAVEQRRLAEDVCRQYIAMQSGINDRARMKEPQTISGVMKGSVFFDLGSAQLSTDEKAKLKSLVKEFSDSSAAEVILVGHADTTGTRKFNQALSTKRAVEVFETLKGFARAENITLPPERIEVLGQGQVDGPLNVNNRQDRRVDVMVVPIAGRANM